ncbi:MAG: hypothetical protein WBW08_03670 [Methyloceanibacter sp.]
MNRASHGFGLQFLRHVTVARRPLETIGDKRLRGRLEELLDLSLRALQKRQYDISLARSTIGDDELFDIYCQMLA